MNAEMFKMYERKFLLSLRSSTASNKAPALKLPSEMTVTMAVSDIHIDTKRKKRKRGRRGGVLVRFRKRTFKAPLPGIALSNARSLCNKKDELYFLIKSRRDFNDCSIICFSETWLDGKTPENALCPEGYTSYRGDRDNNLSGKKGGGGVCILVNQRWCTDSKEINKSCSPDLETLTVQCRPFYSPVNSQVLLLLLCTYRVVQTNASLHVP